MTTMKTYQNILKKIDELEKELCLATEEILDKADKKKMDSYCLTLSSLLFNIKLFSGTRAFKLFEKNLSEKRAILDDFFNGRLDLGINDYQYWVENMWGEEFESAYYHYIYQYNSTNDDLSKIDETAFSKFYKRVINLSS